MGIQRVATRGEMMILCPLQASILHHVLTEHDLLPFVVDYFLFHSCSSMGSECNETSTAIIAIVPDKSSTESSFLCVNTCVRWGTFDAVFVRECLSATYGTYMQHVLQVWW